MAHAQDAGSQAGQLWKAAQAAFAAKDYPTAAKDFNSVIEGSAPDALKWADRTTTTPQPMPPLAKWLEPTFFVMGAAYYNSKDWPNAILTFDRYLKLFPQSPHVAEIHFSLGQAHLFGGTPKEAVPFFRSLMPNPLYHERCVALLAECYNRDGDVPGGISVFETEKKLPNLRPAYHEKINLKLLALYLDHGDIAKGVNLLEEIDSDIDHVPDVTDFNALAIRLGDKLLADNKVNESLNCYRRVRNNQQVLELEKLQIAALQQQLATNMLRIQADPLNSADLQLANADINTQIATDQKVLAQYQTLPPIMPPLLLRIGRAYSVAGQLWESAVVFRELIRKYPHLPETESALYGSIVDFDRARQFDRALSLSQDYLTQFPQGKYAESVSYLRGVLAYDNEQFDQSIGYFKDMLTSQPNTARREQIELVMGDIQLRQGKFDLAIAAYKKYQTDFPSGAGFEKSEYRGALALLFGGKAEEADKAFRAYMEKYPKGDYVADAAYRLDVIKFAAKEYNDVLTDGLAWQQTYGKATPLAEVLALMGDSYLSLNSTDAALKAYTRSYKCALTPESLSYSLFAAAKILEKQADWTGIVTMFQAFMKDNPESPFLVESIAWIGRADVKLGKVDEAKQVMAGAAKQYLADPTREAVDEIITQLAQLSGKRHIGALPPPAPTTTPSATGAASVGASTAMLGSAGAASTASAVGTEVAPPPSDPAKDLADSLTIPNIDKYPTASARIIYAQSELARVKRQADVEQQLLLSIAANYKPEDLSPALLGQVGDCLLQNGKFDQASTLFHELLDDYDESQMVEFAYNGLGQIAYNQKDYKKALDYYGTALDKGDAASKLKEITLGQAQSLLALERYADAKPVFEEVASNRAWRGESTALSVYSLGLVQMGLQKYPEANAFFQRVFVAYQRYPSIQAKAYLKSGEAFEKLGKLTEAANTYNEMLRNPNLTAFPEAQRAGERLKALGQK